MPKYENHNVSISGHTTPCAWACDCGRQGTHVAMDRKARDLASGKKKLEEYKRKKMAKGAALRAQMEHDATSEHVAPPSPTKSEATSDAARNKYQDRLEARLASVLGNKTNADEARDPMGDQSEHGRLDERREKAIVAGKKLSDELAAARADIAAARDLTAHAGDHTPGGYSARSPMSTPGRERDVPRAMHTPDRGNNVDQVNELRERLHGEHAELSKTRGELSALRAVEASREAETARLVASEREAQDLAEAKAAEAAAAATARDEARGENAVLTAQVAALETAKADAVASELRTTEVLVATRVKLASERENVSAAEKAAVEAETEKRAAVEVAENEAKETREKLKKAVKKGKKAEEDHMETEKARVALAEALDAAVTRAEESQRALEEGIAARDDGGDSPDGSHREGES